MWSNNNQTRVPQDRASTMDSTLRMALGWLKAIVRRGFLRGPLLSWWTQRRARQWEHAYCRRLVKPTSQRPNPERRSPVGGTSTLKKMVFIADCMWELNDLVPELRKIAAVHVLNLRPILSASGKNRLAAESVAQAVQEFVSSNSTLDPDLIFFYARPSLLSEDCFSSLRRKWKCPLFGLNLDDKFEFFDYGIFSGGVDNYQKWARYFDVNISNSVAATDWYRQEGFHCIYAPQGVHRPEGLQPPTTADYKQELGFLGSRKPERDEVIGQLATRGISVRVCGQGWPTSSWVENPNSFFRETQINLGIGFASPSLTLTTLKGRDFECPGIGACYLTTYNWELVNHYELGKEILCYRSVEELIEMFSYYRTRPELCLRIAQAAWDRCTREHTWEKRYRKIFQQEGFKLE